MKMNDNSIVVDLLGAILEKKCVKIVFSNIQFIFITILCFFRFFFLQGVMEPGYVFDFASRNSQSTSK